MNPSFHHQPTSPQPDMESACDLGTCQHPLWTPVNMYTQFIYCKITPEIINVPEAG